MSAAVSLLPRQVRRLYGLPWFPPADPAVRLTTYGLLRALNLALPDPPARPPRGAGAARSLTSSVGKVPSAAGKEGAVDEDGSHVVLGGRRWRASDPSIPESLRSQLVHELMAARRAVKVAGGDPAAVVGARARVQDAKVALGERGGRWWEPEREGGLDDARVAATTRALLRHRAPEATVCPSELARAVASPGWRPVMDAVRAVAAALVTCGEIEVRQRGAVVDVGARGPIRYGRGPHFPHPPPTSGSDAPG